MQQVAIVSIPHNKQRYETVGDWFEAPDGTLMIAVSKMSDPRYEVLVAIHELIEVTLCKQRGISQELVDEFDRAFEERRANDNIDEPGDDSHAPYRKEHFFATSIERLVAAELGVDWKTYDEEVNAL